MACRVIGLQSAASSIGSAAASPRCDSCMRHVGICLPGPGRLESARPPRPCVADQARAPTSALSSSLRLLEFESRKPSRSAQLDAASFHALRLRRMAARRRRRQQAGGRLPRSARARIVRHVGSGRSVPGFRRAGVRAPSPCNGKSLPWRVPAPHPREATRVAGSEPGEALMEIRFPDPGRSGPMVGQAFGRRGFWWHGPRCAQKHGA